MCVIYPFGILLIVLGRSNAYYQSAGNRDSEICSHWNGRRHFLELGDRGELHGFNTTIQNIRNAPYTLNNGFTRNKTIAWYQCNLELVTCAECVIRITFAFTNFTKVCDDPNNFVGSLTTRCPCEHIYFTEPPYEASLSGQHFCGNGKVYRSQTRTLSIRFVYSGIQNHIFSLQYVSERNVKVISGKPYQAIVNSNHSNHIQPEVISTPFFPIAYPRDYSVENILSCEAESCHVRLSFTDFHLGISSSLEIFDSNGQMLDTYTGEHFRPPMIVSTGKSLLLRFNGNGATGLGYRADVNFVSERQLKDRETFAYTDCGGSVEGLGGAITMMNMIENSTEVRFYDCIWLLKPANTYMLMKTHMLVRVDTLNGMAQKSELIIRQGITSLSPEVEITRWPNTGVSKKNHIVPVTTGFYVRLRGVFGMSSRVAIVYTIFNYINCYIGSEFLCQNNRCISIRLHCDGFDHCGDNSDELDSCEDEWAHFPMDRRWYQHTPNYYFPKMDRYPDIKTATGVFIISALGLFLVISGWLLILYRMGIRQRNQRELQNHLQTISELLDRQDDLPPDEPPVYEAPPDYEEVIKVGMDDQMSTPRHRRGHERHTRRHHKHHSNSRSRSAHRGDLLTPAHHLVTDENTPCSSAVAMQRSQLQSECLQEIANHVLSATGYCDLTEASAYSSATREQGCQTNTSSSNSLHAKNMYERHSTNQEISDYSLATATQYEESSAEFRDDPFSLSLTIPQTPLTENGTYSSVTNCQKNYNENSHLKRSTVIVYNEKASTSGVRNKIRQTFSFPESFLAFANDFQKKDLSYGSYLRSDRNSGLSNASTFGSDLPADSPTTIQPNRSSQNSRSEYLYTAICPNSHRPESSLIIDPDLEHDISMRRRFSTAVASDYDSDCYRSTNDISCFGAVNLFGSRKTQSQEKPYMRSLSFNQNDERCRSDSPPPPRLKRSSSADYLIRNQSKRLITSNNCDAAGTSSSAYFRFIRNNFS